jgi:hypothetical protein
VSGARHYGATVHNQVPPDPSQQPVAPDAGSRPYAPPQPYAAPYAPYAASDLPPQPYAAPMPYPPFPGYPPPAPSGPNGLAIGALVASICGGLGLGTILGFALGISALVQIRRRPQRGFGLAVAALVISSITLVISIVGLTGFILDEMRDRAAGIEDIDTTELKPGDCISDLDDSSRVYDMPVVPCTQPHKAEVYHVYRFPAGAYPGQAVIEEESDERCSAAFEPYDTAENEDLEIYYLYPENETGWKEDRGVLCIAAAPLEPRTTSLVK